VAAAVLGDATGRPELGAWVVLAAPLWILLAKVHGLYHRDQRALRHLTVDEIPAIVFWSLTGTALLALVLGATPTGSLDAVAALWLAGTVAVAAFVFRAGARLAWRRLTPPARTLIVGDGALAEATRRKLALFPDIHVVVADERRELVPADLEGAPSTGPLDRIILASQTIDERLLADLLVVCRARGIKLSVVPPLRGMFGTAVHLSHVSDLPVLQFNTWPVPRSTLAVKRALDLTLALIGLLVLAPVLAVIAAAIKLDSRGPVLFSQRRAGQGGRPFRMVKFRTMVADAERRLADVIDIDALAEPSFKLRCDPRCTRLGRFLRRTSLDELPQLWNVLRGDMSLVGPRPEQLDLVVRYTDEQRFRLAVKPGMTGPMQVYGRGELRFDERLALEREYIENLSLGRDLRLLALTASTVFTGRGAY
jgi:exopolysaccharide biosynthesis polyprenyl glycosylphosphotransferase